MKNPKLVGSNLIDCIPQTGQCPNNCKECFYNADGFYRTKAQPLIPTIEEAKDKIVRVNSGHDSNIQKELVLEVTKIYKHKFYNTSIPNFDFPAPVVFTCNPKDATWIKALSGNLMMVRFRVSVWNIDMCDKAVKWYTSLGIPFVLTFMRYTDRSAICDEYYEYKKSILNSYYKIRSEFKMLIEQRYTDNDLVGTCGGETGYCKDCRLCEINYYRVIKRS